MTPVTIGGPVGYDRHGPRLGARTRRPAARRRPRAFDAVHDCFNTRLFNFLARLSRRREVAEDLLDETWLRLVARAAHLQPDTRLGPWLFTVARNLYVSYRRSRMLEDSHAVGLIGLWPGGAASGRAAAEGVL